MIRGIHVLAVAAILLGGMVLRATEIYATRYQTLPVIDWLESRPPLAQSAELPTATDLARGLSRALPLLVIRDDAHTRLPSFGPPAVFQRTMGGVRDAARIELGSPGAYSPADVPVRARLDVIVFNRAPRAAAWSELMRREMDVRDPESGQPQTRLAGPDEPDGVWVVAPGAGGGVATVSGRRASVGFVLQVSLMSGDRPDAADVADLSARAETLARQAAADWSAWLDAQISA